MPSLSPEQLSGSLNAPLQALYVLHGEEDLLRLEALDKIRATAKHQGYLNRESHVADATSFDWNNLLAQAMSTGLFADLKLLEIHIPSGKVGKNGGDTLQTLAENLPPDTCTVIVLPKLERAQTQAKWFNILAQYGTVIEAKAIDTQALPAWIRQRLHQHGLEIENDALALFAERVEGNLLAAAQEIDKLALLHPNGHLLTLTDAEQAIANVARFDVFQLSSAWMAGNAQRTLNLLTGLQAEGEEPVLLAWSLAEDIRILIRLMAALKQGKTAHNVRNELRLWGDKQTLAPQAATRIGINRLIKALQICAQIDRQIKGAEDGDAWATFKHLIMDLTH
ncbi:MAG: DNA polymerase III subunit delta [Alysiella sp.]|uniref:DNA polymerase III subunit delta n=1 Tax=Alysiella sp. TaxID=1872483 RepID=UPI0026DDA13C|nr:DNA polymerase III subunit delta [Alysiella sp.]MDO4433770.1 DNA polymerase III subunit delta [Alysiella sp.]